MNHSLAMLIDDDLKSELTLTKSLCEKINSPRSLAIYIMLENSEFESYLDLTIVPDDYLDPQRFAEDYQVSEMLRKSPNLPLMIDREKVAKDAFWASEAQCSDTNRRLSLSNDKRIEVVRRRVEQIVGFLSSSDLKNWEENMRFGPGATTGVKGQRSVPSDKYDEEIHLTYELIPFYRSILGDRWWEHQKNPIIVEGNKFATVPKTAKTDRGICIEPTLNSYAQLGLGKVLRNKLRHAGIDLRSQDKNQYLASIAGREKLATIDLSQASDSISTRCVFELLPPRWLEALDCCRSQKTLIDGKFIELEKFSSMGNGFTFELETLIFYSIVTTIVPKHLWNLTTCYGDDIIVPQQYAREVVDSLNFFGFSVNESKSFLAGNFFESCGTDWFYGQNVRPFYLRGRSGEIPYALQMANALRLWSSRINANHFCDKRFKSCWISLRKQIPKYWCLPGPDILGDSVLLTSKEEARPRVAKHGFEGFAVKSIILSPKKSRKMTTGLLLLALARTGSHKRFSVLSLNFYEPPIMSKGVEIRRGLFGRPRSKTVIVKQWTEGLWWC